MKFESLKSKKDFTNLFKNGTQIIKSDFKIIINVADDFKGIVRVGIIINKKIGSAVKRNRTKRVIREIFRTINKENQKSLDIIIIVKQSISSLTFNDLKEQVIDCIWQYIN